MRRESTQTVEELRVAPPCSAAAGGAGPTGEVRAIGRGRPSSPAAASAAVYAHSTNYPQLTGDACVIAHEHGIALENSDYVQIHPTGLYSTKPGRTFLISGELPWARGAVLLNRQGERFCDELQPRDVVAAAIPRADARRRHRPRMAVIRAGRARGRALAFCKHPAHCQDEEGIDILERPVPVVPTQHYFYGRHPC